MTFSAQEVLCSRLKFNPLDSLTRAHLLSGQKGGREVHKILLIDPIIMSQTATQIYSTPYKSVAGGMLSDEEDNGNANYDAVPPTQLSPTIFSPESTVVQDQAVQSTDSQGFLMSRESLAPGSDSHFAVSPVDGKKQNQNMAHSWIIGRASSTAGSGSASSGTQPQQQ